MTTLERFLVKKQTPKPSDESIPEEVQKKGPNTDLAYTISQLKGIFPAESEENLMLLALQHQNPRDLESVVQRMLENNQPFEVVKQGWSTVKSRDKKKPEQKKGYRQKKQFRNVDEENAEIPGFSKGRGYQRGYNSNKRYENEHREKKWEQNKEEVKEVKVEQVLSEEVKVQESVVEEVEEVKVEQVEERKEEVKVFEEFPPMDAWERAQVPPQEIRESGSVLVARGGEEEKVVLREVSEKIVSPAESGRWVGKKGVETREFGVQVDMEYGIPIIVYPYMFQRS